MSKLKIGDTVTCIDCCGRKELKDDILYTVVYINWHHRYMKVIEKDLNERIIYSCGTLDKYNFNIDRFILVEPNTKKYIIKIDKTSYIVTYSIYHNYKNIKEKKTLSNLDSKYLDNIISFIKNNCEIYNENIFIYE